MTNAYTITTNSSTNNYDACAACIRVIQNSFASEEERNAAFTELYRISHSHVVYKVRKATYDDRIYTDDDRDELVQMVFIKVWNRIGMLENPNAYYGWVNYIVNTTVTDWFRTYNSKRSRDFVPAAVMDDGEEIEYEVGTDLDIPHYNPEANLEQNENHKLLHKLVHSASLTHNQKNVILLTELRDMKLKDAAHVLGMNINTVKTNRRSAMAKLKRTAAAYGYVC